MDAKICYYCNKTVEGEYGFVTIFSDPPKYLHSNCDKLEKIENFDKNGEITDSLILDATLKFCRTKYDNEEDAKANNYAFGRYEQRHKTGKDGKLIFYTHKAPDHVIKRGRELVAEWMPNTLVGRILREYMEIKDRFDEFAGIYTQSIKKYWKKAESRGHTVDCGDFKILLWGCAGRIVFTIQGNKTFGHASINGIMSDEKNKMPANMNGMCGTKKETLDLLEAALKADLKFVDDNGVAPIPVHIMKAQQKAES